MDIQWSLVLFTVLTGLGGWLFLFTCLNTLRGKDDKSGFVVSLVALISVAVGGFASVAHLSHPTRMLNALQHPTSGIFIEAVLVGLLSITIIVFMVMLKRDVKGGAKKAIAAIGIVIGLLMSFMAGQSYMMSSMEAWNTILLPCAYLGTAAVTGAAAYLAIIALKKADSALISDAAKYVIGTSILSLLTTVAYAVVAQVFSSPEMVLYLAAVLLVGGAIPLLCGFLALKKVENGSIFGWTALIAGLVGSIAFRCVMWLLGVGLYGFFGIL